MNAELKAQTNATHKKKRRIWIRHARKLAVIVSVQFPCTLVIWQPFSFVSCNVRHTAVASLTYAFLMQESLCADIDTDL